MTNTIKESIEIPPNSTENNIHENKKNAIKIIFEKGVKLTQTIKTSLKDELGCEYNPIHKAYMCPIQNRSLIDSLFKEKKIKARFQDVLDITSSKPKVIRGLEARILRLEEDVYLEDQRLVADVYKYDRTISVSDFSLPPSKEEKSDRKINYESDFHQRYLAIQEKKKEIDNLRNSLNLHEEEGEQGGEIIEYLSKNEIGDAELFTKLFGAKYLFDPAEGKEGAFYLWNGSAWALDLHKQRYKDFESISKTYLNALKTVKFEESVREDIEKRVNQLRTNRRRANVLETVSAYISFKGKWGHSPYLLPCQNGVIDLKSGNLIQSNSHQYIKKICPLNYNPTADCPKFDAFLNDITLGDEELKGFFGRLFGYMAIGIPCEEKIFYFYGSGRNGKGTLVKAIQNVLGPLSKTFPAEMLLIQRNLPSASSPSPELANLEGTRIAFFSEIGENKQIDAAKVKNLSGRDIISCRRLFSNVDLQIEPTHTLLIQTNEKPRASADDKALWARNVLIPFAARFVENPSKTNEKLLKEGLKDELLNEAEGILCWLVRGSLEYQKNGLLIPKSVLALTESYRQENDGIGCFLSERCLLDSAFSTPCQTMINEIQEYCRENGKFIPNRIGINTYLSERFQKAETKKGNFWKGISIQGKDNSDD